jgi:hypothetical protein
MVEPGVEPMRVGVLLGPVPEPIGSWLADAAAFDASGADALWVQSGPELDVFALAAALAVVTFRARLVVLPGSGVAGVRRTVDTVGRLSNGRLVLVSESGEPGGFRRVAGETGVFEDGDGGRWESVAAPGGRAAWREVCADAARNGVRGLVVPADPRLLDILRNPEDPGERHDLQLAQG